MIIMNHKVLIWIRIAVWIKFERIRMNYNIFDENPYVGQSYYRLMQTDYDGKNEK